MLAGLVLLTILSSSLIVVQAEPWPPEKAVPAPALISPANGAETTGNPSDPNTGRVLYEPLGIPTFEWQDVGASRYELEVATTAAFSVPVFKLDRLEYPSYSPNGDGESSPGFSLISQSGDFQDQATFYWRVRAWDDDLGQWSGYSPVWSFTRHWGYKPVLQYPADNAIVDMTPYFAWDPVPGASFYQIQIDTSSSFGSPTLDATTDVPNLTPDFAFANDDDLFWRVRAFHRPNTGNSNGDRGGPWSEVYQFKLDWASDDTRVQLLTPPDNANYINRPLYCWTPVPGAKRYKIDVADSYQFISGSFVVKDKWTEGTCYSFERDGTYTLEYNKTYYWKVTPFHYNNGAGQSSDFGGTAFQFTSAPSEPPQVPTLFYPPYYYTPIMAETFEDRTVAVPTFMWDHVEGATRYELCIDDDIVMDCSATGIVVETANASYTFTDTATYPLEDNTVYYWKVRANGWPDWSQLRNKWKTRIDRSRVFVTDTVKLIKPTYQVEGWSNGYKVGEESVTYYPVLGWTGTTTSGRTYRVQIAQDDDFEAVDVVHDVETDFTEYTPTEAAAPGTYYWRVRQEAPSTGDWSETGRFIVSRNFESVPPVTIPGLTRQPITVDGDPADWIDVNYYMPAGESGDASAPHDLIGAYVASDSLNWYFGIPISSTTKLGIYFDSDHLEGSGATVPPSGGDPFPPLDHRPEYAIYWDNVNFPDGALYEWAAVSWAYVGLVEPSNGNLAYDETSQFLEIRIPVSRFSTTYYKGSLSMLLFTLDGSNTVQDRMPNLRGRPDEVAFLTDSTAPTPLLPANAPQDRALATIEHNTPVLTWRHNEDGTQNGEFIFHTFEDDLLTGVYHNEQGHSPKGGSFADSYTHWAPQDHYSDNQSYHWTIERAQFTASAPNHFHKAGFPPVDLQFSPVLVSDTLTYTNRTPAFSWQPAQSAPSYYWRLEGEEIQDRITPVPYWTPRDAIRDGTYIWKVWARDANNNLTSQIATGEFRKLSEAVSLSPVDLSNGWPLFQWTPLDYAAYYRVKIADDSGFSKNAYERETYNAAYTPGSVPRAIENDGSFYLRVIPYDNDGNPGPATTLEITEPIPQDLDHFVFAPFGDQVAGVDFTITITAETDVSALLVPYSGYANLSDVTGSLVPNTVGPFENGVWTGHVSITQAYVGNALTATHPVSPAIFGSSNPFNVSQQTVARLGLEPKTFTISAGQSVTYTVTATDTYDNSWDATPMAQFAIEQGAGGTWKDNVYTSQFTGTWTVIANISGTFDTASLIINPVDGPRFQLYLPSLLHKAYLSGLK
jgi:hypothetical protein